MEFWREKKLIFYENWDEFAVYRTWHGCVCCSFSKFSTRLHLIIVILVLKMVSFISIITRNNKIQRREQKPSAANTFGFGVAWWHFNKVACCVEHIFVMMNVADDRNKWTYQWAQAHEWVLSWSRSLLHLHLQKWNSHFKVGIVSDVWHQHQQQPSCC